MAERLGLRRWQKAALAAGGLLMSAGLLTGASKLGFKAGGLLGLSQDLGDCKACSSVVCPVGKRHIQFFDEAGTWSLDPSECCTPVSRKTVALAADSDLVSRTGVYLKPDGTVIALGSNAAGNLNPLPAGKKVVEVAAGAFFTLYLTDDGKVFSIGQNDRGELGHGVFTANETVAKEVIGLPRKVVSIAAGWHFSLFLLDDGRVFGTGAAGLGWGQLGLLHKNVATPVQVFEQCSAIFASDEASFCLKGDGTVEMTGALLLWPKEPQEFAENGTALVTYHVPTKLDVCEVSTIATSNSADSVFFIRYDGSVYGMGTNVGGPLGLGDNKPRTRPVALPDSVKNIVAGSAGTDPIDGDATDGYRDFSILVDKDGKVYGAGSNARKQLGSLAANGNFKHSLIPELKGIFVVGAAGGASDAAFIKKDGTLLVAGANSNGELSVTGTDVAPTAPTGALR